MGAAAGEREGAVAAAVLLGWRHQALLAIDFTVALGLSAVFAVAAPLAPEAWTLLLAAQMVQGRSPLSGAWDGAHR